MKYTFVDSLFGGYLMSTVTCEECKNVRQGNWLKVTLKQVDLDLGSGITLFYVIMCKILGRNQKRSIDLIMIFNKARGIFHLWYHFKICLLHLWEHIKSFTCFCNRLSFVYWVHMSTHLSLFLCCRYHRYLNHFWICHSQSQRKSPSDPIRCQGDARKTAWARNTKRTLL